MNNTIALSAKSYRNLKREMKIGGPAGNFTEEASYNLSSGRCPNHNVEELKIVTENILRIKPLQKCIFKQRKTSAVLLS